MDQNKRISTGLTKALALFVSAPLMTLPAAAETTTIRAGKSGIRVGIRAGVRANLRAGLRAGYRAGIRAGVRAGAYPPGLWPVIKTPTKE